MKWRVRTTTLKLRVGKLGFRGLGFRALGFRGVNVDLDTGGWGLGLGV